MDKVFATWWSICCGWGLANFIFNGGDNPWDLLGTCIYFLLFIATLYQIKAKQSVWVWFAQYRKKRREWRENPNNWSV
ncbi:hypothetical protein QCN37_gp78 [Arthrobacter phage Tatanka]|uniref:Uncharacterized protein n=1 Tax=Arthrobacter phage Tatanka TaxID=2250368 RepID=A0A2Z5HGZ1_9CAUD|nr:hypothetical protein QCN37_gp78 [Arthrobacter phage Tatanka]AXC38702.1 hypothetical protein SEA_TATANKA_78 [Arthrobacter phage Tatanka]